MFRAHIDQYKPAFRFMDLPTKLRTQIAENALVSAKGTIYWTWLHGEEGYVDSGFMERRELKSQHKISLGYVSVLVV
jgi:hypothetical protein